MPHRKRLVNTEAFDVEFNQVAPNPTEDDGSGFPVTDFAACIPEAVYKPYIFAIAGVMFENRTAKIKQHCEVNTPILLHREPKNAYDQNAIAVRVHIRRGRSISIGYVPRTIAKALARFMDNGMVIIDSHIVNLTTRGAEVQFMMKKDPNT